MSNEFTTNFDNNFFCATTLDQAEMGISYVVVSCNLPRPLDVRFAELGFVAGAKVTVNKRAPLNDPMEVTVMGYSLCVRANEAKRIVVEREHNE